MTKSTFEAVAEAQVSMEVAQKITGRTELLALIAYPIRHSDSPRMHNLALAKLGLDYAYLAFEVDAPDLEDAIRALRVLKVRGWNVSMPNKMEVIKYLDHISTAAELIGACNTIVNDNGVLRGENTDGLGYMAALREQGVETRDKKITLIGAGGAAMAIATQAALDGVASIHIFNRRDDFFAKGEANAAKISEKTNAKVSLHDLDDLETFHACVKDSAVLANATNVGFKGKLEGLSPLPDPGVLRPDLFVTDSIYAPRKTKFLEQAEAAGCRTMNGIPMMLHQGAAAFKMWTGNDMPLDYVKDHLFA
ncbi:shikimate dehydrogenase [Beijerinckia mobilis]|uniref:shikimate dehydrogenase n=1 Tax=Beijerinckia mobilis TaxID=231434 RepID=UPI001AEC3BE8|nr:shikimate dehydrogenase [Beijerinckia mobilis]